MLSGAEGCSCRENMKHMLVSPKQTDPKRCSSKVDLKEINRGLFKRKRENSFLRKCSLLKF